MVSNADLTLQLNNYYLGLDRLTHLIICDVMKMGYKAKVNSSQSKLSHSSKTKCDFQRKPHSKVQKKPYSKNDDSQTRDSK